jgi:hypothetical protein
MNWSEHFYYDETSKSCLRRLNDVRCGKGYKVVRAKAGDEAGGISVLGYWDVRCGASTKFKGHRVVWELFNGPIPNGMQIDHVNGDRADNRLANLRCVETVTNTRNKAKRKNSTSDVNGVNFKFNGTGSTYWASCWVDLDGVQRSKNFSIQKLGDVEAFKAACLHRENVIKKLNELGAGYTERHGQ